MKKWSEKRKGLLSLGYLWIIMAVFLFFIRLWVKGRPDLLEKIYPLALNQKITGALSLVTGMVPISLGELFVYLNLILALIFAVFLGVKIFQGGAVRHLLRGITYVSLLFVIFMVIFGFNYERVSVRDAFMLVRTNYSVEELYQLNEALITQANALRQQVTEVSMDELQVGDILYFGNSRVSHTAIYAGNNTMLHAPRPDQFIEIRDIGWHVNNFEIVGARRYLD